MDLRVMRTPESKSHIFSVWSVCMYVCVCVSVISIAQRQITAETFKFGILHLYHIQMPIEFFYEDRTKTLCAETHKRILIH